jgi:hypothetical protein
VAGPMPAADGSGAAATSPGAGTHPVPRRQPSPIAPALPGMATAGAGGGSGGGIASLLLAALLGGLVLLAPGRGGHAPMRERNLHSSLSSKRPERPG